MIELHGHQKELVAKIREAYGCGYKAPLVVLSTGGGKTTIFAYITHAASEKGSCIFLLAHRSELIKQISQTLARLETEHQIIAPDAIIRQAKVDHWKEFNRSYINKAARVYVASVQTIVRRLETITAIPDIIVIDEAHHLTRTTQWGKVINHYPAAKLLPVTATPCRTDGKGLGIKSGGYADTMIEGKPMRWLIDNEYLCDYRIFAPDTVDLTGVKTRMGDYAIEQLATAVDKPKITGSAIEHYRKLVDGKRAIVFCVNVKHAEHVAEEFNAAGIRAELLEGTMESGVRNEAIQRFRSGETLVLTSCNIVSEGFDLPAIEAAILLRPTQSKSLYLQQVGRALRVMEGKDCAYILDHVGAVMRHGLPDDDHDWSLDGAKKRNKKGAEKDVNVARCPVCFAIHRPAPCCPQCGHAYIPGAKKREIKQVEGELVEITPEARLLIRKQRITEERQCKTLEDFIELGRSRDYKFPRQWAEKRFGFRMKRNG